MFTGTTPEEVRILLQDLMTGVKKKDVFIGCSGNFTVDKIMSKMGYSVHSNDVSLYSKLIADILLGTDTEVKVAEKWLVPVFDSWPDSKYKKLIQVMFVIKISEFHEQKNDYQKAFFEAYISKSVSYYESTIAKLEKGALDFKIESFDFCDFIGFLKNSNSNGVGLTFPPTYKAGYEKIFNLVEKCFEYERAKYDLFDPKNGGTIFKELLESGENIIYTDREWPNIEQYKSGVVNLGSGKHEVNIYSSLEKSETYYFDRKAKPLTSGIQILPAEYQFTDKSDVKVGVCNVSEINYFKAFYMANKVNYTTGGDIGLAFYADGKAFGFVSFSKTLSTLEMIFMQSDFVVNSNTQKLSKLLIMLVKSRETRKIISRKMCNYFEGIKTSVFTDKPISMKYRGVFDLERREKGKLIYVAKFQEKTLNEIYLSWLKKTSK